MKKLLAFAFVAGMMAFAACTSKPAEEGADTTSINMDIDTMTVDTSFADTTMMSDSL
ncbi:hypothetical protein GCM10027275_01290 [Rhabdobacter roseus]|uniref:ABC-type proline/glycine betaine transport system substrate-binding protein n=1 Tax=Rhabdobacter roseus TaxID=1655419 RepID=A0A840TLB6_9BACT|nr:hypothetical protein [Rhabdobacter roseus]MBB5282013.1 ABC-type proline/glycine betaine transport system substrate-binding protein [Rhabdobacter roseus]